MTEQIGRIMVNTIQARLFDLLSVVRTQKDVEDERDIGCEMPPQKESISVGLGKYPTQLR